MSSTCSQLSSTSSNRCDARSSTIESAQRPVRSLLHVERVGDGGGDRVRFADRRELDEAYAVGETVGDGRGEAVREPGLADATGPEQREDPPRLEQPARELQVGVRVRRASWSRPGASRGDAGRAAGRGRVPARHGGRHPRAARAAPRGSRSRARGARPTGRARARRGSVASELVPRPAAPRPAGRSGRARASAARAKRSRSGWSTSSASSPPTTSWCRPTRSPPSTSASIATRRSSSSRIASGRDPLRVGELGERGAAPLAERGVESRRAASYGSLSSNAWPRRGRLEPAGVDQLLGDLEHVTGRAVLERGPGRRARRIAAAARRSSGASRSPTAVGCRPTARRSAGRRTRPRCGSPAAPRAACGASPRRAGGDGRVDDPDRAEDAEIHTSSVPDPPCKPLDTCRRPPASAGAHAAVRDNGSRADRSDRSNVRRRPCRS